jgi:hypothetical protein
LTEWIAPAIASNTEIASISGGSPTALSDRSSLSDWLRRQRGTLSPERNHLRFALYQLPD